MKDADYRIKVYVDGKEIICWHKFYVSFITLIWSFNVLFKKTTYAFSWLKETKEVVSGAVIISGKDSISKFLAKRLIYTKWAHKIFLLISLIWISPLAFSFVKASNHLNLKTKKFSDSIFFLYIHFSTEIIVPLSSEK